MTQISQSYSISWLPLFIFYTKYILKASFWKDNGSLTGDTILFFRISQELWSFKKLGYITQKRTGALMAVSFSSKWNNLTKSENALDFVQGVFGSARGCPLISPTSSQRQSSINIYKFFVFGVYQFSSVRSIITIWFILDTYCKYDLISIMPGIQVVENRIQFSGFGHGYKTFSRYQSSCITDIHRQIPDLLNLNKKKPNYTVSSRQPGHLNLDPWLSVSRSLEIWLYLLDAMPDFFCKYYAQWNNLILSKYFK